MDERPPRKPLLTSIWLGIILAPAGLGFIIAACLSGGPREVYKALRRQP